MTKGRYDVSKHGFPKKDKPLRAKLTVMLTQEMMDALNEQVNKAEFVRQAIQEKLSKQVTSENE